MNIIKNGKNPDEPYNAALGFWLPPDSPYGNFQLKYMKIIQRLDEANRNIISSHHFWQLCKGATSIAPIGAYEQHTFSNEKLIYMLRRAADELISLIWCLDKYKTNNEYPSKIKVDCLGAILSQDKKTRIAIFQPHLNLIQVLNEISNAHKHSFINSDHSLLGADEPCIHALSLDYNKLSSEPVFFSVSLDSIINDYSAFFNDCKVWLSDYSERNR